MQGHAAHQLHVEVALPQHPPGPFAHHGEGLDQQVVEGLALGQPLTELDGLVPQSVVAQGLHIGLERTDHGHELGQAADFLALPGLENFGEHTHEGR